jgi:hypothetical protein
VSRIDRVNRFDRRRKGRREKEKERKKSFTVEAATRRVFLQTASLLSQAQPAVRSHSKRRFPIWAMAWTLPVRLTPFREESPKGVGWGATSAASAAKAISDLERRV